MASSSSFGDRKNGLFPMDRVSRDPSYPDRARIDSDVRAFLRPASSPWMVFDRDSRVGDDFAKSALRVGAVFASRPSYRPSAIEANLRRSQQLTPIVITEAAASPAAPAVEPSSIVVAADVLVDPAETTRTHPRRGRLAALAGACAAVLAVAAVVGVGQVRSRAHVGVASASGQARASTVVAPAFTSETKPEAATPRPPPTGEPAPVATPAITTADTSKTLAASKKRFGRLTLKGEATRKIVWFDGKRMLGTGQRTFTVYCGMHTVAVNDRADTKDIEIPCNGEYVVSR